MEEAKNDIVMNGQPDTILFQDACHIIEQAQAVAYHAVDVTHFTTTTHTFSTQ